jgi:hypothetical protein
VPSSCTVLIAAASVLPALKERASTGGAELLAFSDVDTLRALDAINQRRPSIVALDRAFAATPRGAALINRIKADPALAESEIRVVSHDPGPAVSREAAAPPSEAPAVTSAPAETPDDLDEHGTRRTARVNIAGLPDITIDGNAASLVDLSAIGAQVLSPTVLRPNQRVRVTFSDSRGTIRVNGVVVWATFEIPPKIGPRYRAGVEFSDADARSIHAYCDRNSAQPS